MKKVIFICAENACRSQMAEALANHFFKNKVKAFSAGICPKEVHPFTIEVLKELGVETSGLRSKHVDEFKDQEFDLAIALCDPGKEECFYLPNAREHIHAPFPDPAKGTVEDFRKVRDLIIQWLRDNLGEL